MARYYDDESPTLTLVPKAVLAHHTADAFVQAVDARLGSAIAAQAAALLGRDPCERQNPNALEDIRRFAVASGETELAVAIGAYLDRLSY